MGHCYGSVQNREETNYSLSEKEGIYIFIHGRPLGSYDTTLRQNHIWKVTVHVSDDTLSRQAERSSDRASNYGRAASQSLKRLPSGYCAARLPSQAPTGSIAQCSRLADAARGRGTSVGSCEQPVPGCTQAPLPLFGSPHRWWHADSGC